MKKMYVRFAAGLAIVFLSGFVLLTGCSAPEPVKEKKQERKESPEEPYEDFMLQRTYPNKTFEINTYRNAMQSAVQQASVQRSAASLTWQLEGPGNIGGRFNCLAVHPTNSSIMYAGSANGGVWKTTDNGNNWTPISDALPYQAVGAIAINPNNGNEIWIGMGDVNINGTMYAGDGVYKSIDAGVTWTYLGLSNTYVVSGIVFNPNNTNEVLIGTMGNSFDRDNNRGMYRTSDGGNTFTNTLFVNDSTGIIDLIQNPATPAIVYCSSFSRLRTDRESVTYGTEVYVYKSIDFGQTWQMLAGGLPNGNSHQRLGLGLCASSPNTVYALYSTSDGVTDPELYKTTNGGTNWSQVNISTFDLGSYGAYGWYFGKIYVDPNNANKIFMPGVDLQYSTNGGQTWSMLTPPWWMYQVHADGHWIHFNSSSDMIYCTDGGLYRTTDGGNNWTDIENIPNNQFYAVTENPNLVGEYAGGVQDNGTMFGNASVINNFTRIYGGDGFTVQYTSNPQLLYTETQNGGIVYDDAFPSGNWQGIDMDFNQTYNWHTPYFTSVHDETKLYYGGQEVNRISGAPYGNSVSMSPSLVDPSSPSRVQYITTIHQSPLTANIFYAGTADGKVWNTLNNGGNWNDITPFQGNQFYVTRVLCSPNTNANAYVTRSGYRSNDNTPLIFKTTNNGTSWTNISGNLPMLAVNDILITPGDENKIFIANDAGVYYTIDGGVNWQILGTGMPFVAVLDIAFNYNEGTLIAGTFGRSIYSIDIQTITGIVNTESASATISLYPNPVTELLNVQSDKTVDRISIFNLSGELVGISATKSADVSRLAAGLYIAEVSVGGKVVREKFLKR